MKIGVMSTGRQMKRALDRASRDVSASQRAVLDDILAYAKGTRYGTAHGFSSVRSPREYAEAVPINEYEDLRPFVARHASGEPDVLFPGKPLFYATTSGTTAAPKLIPITRKYHDGCYNGLTKLWFYSMFQEMPGFLDGRDLTMVGKAVEGRTPDGTTYGSFSGHMNAYMPGFVKRFRVIPNEVHDTDDYVSKYYTLMRVALEHPIRMIVAANPSNLLELHRVTTDHFDEMVFDIERGTLKASLDMPGHIRQAVEARLSPNPKRAAVLSALQKAHGTLLPRHYWPNLEVVNTWKQGNSGLYLKHTEGFYPDAAAIREFGYLATEARAGIVLSNDQETSILAAHLLFFEFIKKRDFDSDNPRVYLADELEMDEEYYLLITTPSGLYRYNMNDIVRVEGFYNEFPMVRFIQKGRGVTSLTGEKLYESQYTEAVASVEASLGFQADFHIGFADFESSRYHVFIEPGTTLPTETLNAIAGELDRALCRVNMEYDSKRKSNRLKPLAVHELKTGAFVAYKQNALEGGAREGQFKLTQLSIDHDRFTFFKSIETKPSQRENEDIAL